MLCEANWRFAVTTASQPRRTCLQRRVTFIRLAVELYFAWRHYEWAAWKRSMEEEFAPPLFFHLAIELITISRRDPNFRSAQHQFFGLQGPGSSSTPRLDTPPLPGLLHVLAPIFQNALP
jgi:hypothetical protein